MNKTILITGCSSGIGRMTAKYFQQKGWNVIATVRNNPEDDTELNALDNVFVAELDVTNSVTIHTAVTEALDHFGRIDVLLNNAGYGSYGLLESTPEKKIRQQFDVNVIGALMVIKAVIPHMRARGSGTIINISSMGGKVTFPLGTLYHGSKFAVEGMSEALSFELNAIGIRVKMIEPGMIDTNFAATTFRGLDIDPSLEEYKDFLDHVTKGMEQTSMQASDPLLVAETIYQAATDNSDQMRYVAGSDAEQLLAARKQMNDAEYMSMLKSQIGLQ